MIDLEKAKVEFLEYVKQYDDKSLKVNIKIQHNLRVMEISNCLAKKRNLNEEEIQVATLIGLLHDIGRFEEYIIKENGIKETDHAKLGVEILENNNYIRKYVNNDKYDNFIKKAIFYHNKKYEQEYQNNKENKLEKTFCDIIKDSDNIDILYEEVEIFWKGREIEIGKETITQEVKEAFYNKNFVRKRIMKTNLDDIIGAISFIFIMKFEESLKLIKQKNLINRILDRYEFINKETNGEIKEIRKIANQYIEEKTK